MQIPVHPIILILIFVLDLTPIAFILSLLNLPRICSKVVAIVVGIITDLLKNVYCLIYV